VLRRLTAAWDHPGVTAAVWNVQGWRADPLSAGRRLIIVGGLTLGIAACARPDSQVSAPTATAPRPAAATAAGPPEWRPGDQWTFRWSVGNQGGTRTAEVVEVRTLGAQTYYVLRIGDVDHLYTPDLHVAATLKNETVQSRLVPPTPLFTWPLAAGRRWEHRGTYEEPGGKREVADSFTVIGSEMVETPAGRFNAIRVARTGSSGDSDEYWYAPEVHFYVKWLGRRGEAQVEEQLVSYRLVGGGGTPSGSTPPSGPGAPPAPSGSSRPVTPPSAPSGSPSTPK
jgi:hypothetical protein